MTTRVKSTSVAERVQGRLIPFLLNPLSYAHRPKSVRLVQTHASLVFIAPPLVFKVKRPVNFGFLDFNTLEKRRQDCEREVVLNRRLTTGTYLDVVPIRVRAGHFAFGAEGRVVEYAVRMRQLSPGNFLDRRLACGSAGPIEMDRVADVLKTFYLGQHPTPEIEQWGRIQRVRISTDENFRQVKAYVGHTLSASNFEALQSYTRTFFRAHGALFESRVRERWIRDCHGDLHLEHIHVTPRQVQIYDWNSKGVRIWRSDW
jgi:hypothetical protein